MKYETANTPQIRRSKINVECKGFAMRKVTIASGNLLNRKIRISRIL